MIIPSTLDKLLPSTKGNSTTFETSENKNIKNRRNGEGKSLKSSNSPSEEDKEEDNQTAQGGSNKPSVTKSVGDGV